MRRCLAFAEGALIGVIGNDYDSPIIELGAAR